MRKAFIFGLGLVVAAPVAALAGPAAPARGPLVFQHAASGWRVHHAPQGHVGLRHGAHRAGGYFGGIAGYPQIIENVSAPAPAMAAVAASAAPRTMVVYNGPPPLAQGDAGYVAQPLIYSVGEALRSRPLGGRRVTK